MQLNNPFALFWFSAPSLPYCYSKAVYDALKNASPSAHAWFHSIKRAVVLGKGGFQYLQLFSGSDSPGGTGHNLGLYYQNGKIALWAQTLVPYTSNEEFEGHCIRECGLPASFSSLLSHFFLSFNKTKPLLCAKHWSSLCRRKAKIFAILKLPCNQWLTSLMYLLRAKCLQSTLCPSRTFVGFSSMNVCTCSLSLVIFMGWNSLLGLKSSSLDFSLEMGKNKGKGNKEKIHLLRTETLKAALVASHTLKVILVELRSPWTQKHRCREMRGKNYLGDTVIS